MEKEEKKEQNNYKEQEKAALLSFLFNMPGFIGLVVTIVLTGSLVTLIDFLDSLCNLIRDGFLFLLSKRLQSNLKYEYNYGVGRLETLSALCCDFVMITGLIIVFSSSIKELFGPTAPSGLLLFALVCKIGAVITDTYMLYKQYKIKKTNNNGVSKVAFAGALKNVCFDGTILVAYVICWVFRENPTSYYFSPVLCIIIAIVLGRASVLRIIDNVRELIDKTLDEDLQMKIIKILNRYFDEYEELLAINSHKISGKLCIDLEISFEKEKTYEEISDLRNRLEMDLNKEMDDCVLTIVISGNEGK